MSIYHYCLFYVYKSGKQKQYIPKLITSIIRTCLFWHLSYCIETFYFVHKSYRYGYPNLTSFDLLLFAYEGRWRVISLLFRWVDELTECLSEPMGINNVKADTHLEIWALSVSFKTLRPFKPERIWRCLNSYTHYCFAA